MINRRLFYTKGMRASLKLLLEDARLRDEARDLVEEHLMMCNAAIAELERTKDPVTPAPLFPPQKFLR